MTVLHVIQDLLLVGVALVGAAADVRYRRVPDWLTIPAVVIGVALQTAVFGIGAPFDQGLVAALFGAAFCGTVFGVFWLWGRGFASGDVKLMVALGAIGGTLPAMRLCMAIALVGAALALIALIFGRDRVAMLWARVQRQGGETPPASEKISLPYGLAIGLGTMWTVGSTAGILPGF